MIQDSRDPLLLDNTGSISAQVLTEYDVPSITAIETALSAEVTRATTAEGQLATDLAAEVTRATGVEATKADDNMVVHLAQAETISGDKTFTGETIVPDQTALDNSTKAANTKYVDAAVATALLADQIWLPAVTTKVLLDALIPPNIRLNYLCRVIADTTVANIGVWQWVAVPAPGTTGSWTYFSDNQDFVDDNELETRIETLVPAVTAPNDKVWIPNSSGTAGDPLRAMSLATLITNILAIGGTEASGLTDAIEAAMPCLLSTIVVDSSGNVTITTTKTPATKGIYTLSGTAIAGTWTGLTFDPDTNTDITGGDWTVRVS